MKHLYSFSKLFSIYLIALSAAHIPLLSHGFGMFTQVHLADGSLEEIGQLCHRALDKKLAVATYDTSTATLTANRITRCGQSKTPSYIRFCFSGSSLKRAGSDKIICTPTQEFYLPSTHSWIPAYQLKVGDTLLCKRGTQTIAEFEYVQQKLPVYTLEIKNTHTFFVGYHGALTHNMVIPAAFGLGMSIPFGSAAGASAGSFFGPPALVAGAVIGSLVGAFVSLTQSDSIPKYKIDLGDRHYIDNFIHQQNSASNNSNSISSGSSCMSPMPNGPKKDDDKNRKKLSENQDDLKHIFRKARNHFPKDTPEVRRLIEECANDISNYLGPDCRGHDWYSKILKNGRQLWAKVEGNIIKNAGINDMPRIYNPITGLCNPPTKI